MDIIKVLVIDDSEDDRMQYRRALQKSAEVIYKVIEAEDGEEGIALIEQQEPGCVLLDYSLPGRNGIEVLKRIRGKRPFIPILILTGQGNEAVAVTAMQEGAQNYISKSAITSESLQRIIRVAIEHCASHKRLHEQRTSLEVFTRALAHDLKEPMRTIQSFLELFVSHEPMSEKGKHYFNYIQNAADRMSTLIDTVYFYTRLEGDEPQIDKEACDMAGVLEAAKENIDALVRERGAAITSDPLPSIQANRMQMIQVIQNLLCNAIRHCEQAPRIHVRAEELHNEWLFRISDNGAARNDNHYEQAFNPTIKPLSRHKEQGLGLGLAMCGKIIESHGGKIWYESRADAGATFLFTIPKAKPESKTNPKHPVAKNALIAGHETGDRRLATILLVEDNDADIELTRLMLIEEAHLRCNLLVARDAKEAIDTLYHEIEQNRCVDLVLLDINMPGMDGFDLLRFMHTDEALQSIPVVMCTTSNYDKDIGKAKLLGVVGYLTKPAELHKLKAIIDHTTNVQLCPEGDGYALLSAA